MQKLYVDFSEAAGKIKPMNAVNNGPVGARADQTRGNFEAYRAAKIPFARTHDASYFSEYGGEHSVDVHAVFPDFTKNPYDPSSYDFTLTDDYLNSIRDAGTGVYYRLGSKIEHWRKKYGTIVPADFQKWAVICEHIIRHYNEGWADGFHLDIDYWEIWNEPDGVKGNGDQPNWSGTPEQFYEFYKTAAKHLKKCFPNRKIGGPALSWVKNEDWFDGFLAALTEDGEKTPLDFFSWHAYPQTTEAIVRDAEIVRRKLDEAGYRETENHLNEWNYLEGWTDEFISSIQNIIGIRGAAYSAASMITGQKSCLDMMMYYDARPCTFNGLFDYYTLRPLKGYYPFCMYAELAALGTEAKSDSECEDLYILAAEKDGKKAIMITYYSPDKTAEAKEIELELRGEDVGGAWRIQRLDSEDTMADIQAEFTDNRCRMSVKPDSVLFFTK